MTPTANPDAEGTPHTSAATLVGMAAGAAAGAAARGSLGLRGWLEQIGQATFASVLVLFLFLLWSERRDSNRYDREREERAYTRFASENQVQRDFDARQNAMVVQAIRGLEARLDAALSEARAGRLTLESAVKEMKARPPDPEENP